MGVIDGAVDVIEDKACKDGCKGHGTPVLGESMDTKGFGNEGWVDSKEEAVGHCRVRLGAKDDEVGYREYAEETYNQ